MKKLLFILIIFLISFSAKSDTYLLVAEYGENPLKTTRWPDGTVYVHDATNYSDLDSVLILLNANTQNTKFVSTSNKDIANITIDWSQDFDYPYKDKCGLTQTHVANNLYTKATILLKPGACTKTGTIFSLYLHELGHALGFARHTTSEDVMAESLYDKGHYESVNILTNFLMGLYNIPPGSIINKDIPLPRANGSSLAIKNTDRGKPAIIQQKKKPAEIITLKPLMPPEASTIGKRRVEVITPQGIQYKYVD